MNMCLQFNKSLKFIFIPENPRFRGNRYMKDNDTAVILLFDKNGYIAGIQAGVSHLYMFMSAYAQLRVYCIILLFVCSLILTFNCTHLFHVEYMLHRFTFHFVI